MTVVSDVSCMSKKSTEQASALGASRNALKEYIGEVTRYGYAWHLEDTTVPQSVLENRLFDSCKHQADLREVSAESQVTVMD